MKNISIALNGVLIVAVIILYYLHFSVNSSVVDATNENKETAEHIDSTGVNLKNNQLTSSNVGYLNVDSLQKHYKLYTELIDQLKAREKRYSKELDAKSAALEQKFKEFQKKAPTMTQFEGQTKQKELMKEEQDLYKMRDDFSTKFQEEESKLNKKFQKKVKDFIKKYNEEKNYNIIIGASQLGNIVLDYNEDIDISEDVIKGLNEQYEKENTSSKTEKRK